MRRHLLPVSLLLTLVGATALTGCSGDSSSGAGNPSASASPTPTASTSSSASSSPSPSASPTETGGPSSSPSGPPLPHNRLAAASYHKVILERNAASTPQEQAVVDAWIGYWQVVSDVLFNAQPSPELDAVASGSAHRDVLSLLEKYHSKGWRSVGWTKDNVLSVDVTGDSAKVRDCTKNYTFAVDEEGEPASTVVPWYYVTGTLEKQQGTWIVVKQETENRYRPCLP